jgi:hypothetical protein
LLNVLAETGWEVTHQEIGLLNRFFRVHEVVPHLRANHGVSQAGRRGVSASRRAPVGFGVMASKKVVKDMTRVGQQVGGKGWPVFGEQGRNGLKRAERFFPRTQPNIDLLFAVIETSVQSCIPSTNPVLQCPHQTDGTAFSL